MRKCFFALAFMAFAVQSTAQTTKDTTIMTSGATIHIWIELGESRKYPLTGITVCQDGTLKFLGENPGEVHCTRREIRSSWCTIQACYTLRDVDVKKTQDIIDAFIKQ